MTTEAQRDFVRRTLPLAQQASRLTGVPVPVILAQAALESDFGRSSPGNAYFGIKADKSWRGLSQLLRTHEEKNGQLVPTMATFRKYNSALESFLDWANFIKSNPRYRHALAAKTPEEALRAFASSGYATDSNYYSKLASRYRILKAYEVEQWQSYLNSLGATLLVDGDAGPATRNATKIFQHAMGLVPSGVVDPKTRAAANELSRHHSPFFFPEPPTGPDVPSRLDFAEATKAKGTPMAPSGMMRKRIPFDGPVPVPPPPPAMNTIIGSSLPSTFTHPRPDAETLNSPPSGIATTFAQPSTAPIPRLRPAVPAALPYAPAPQQGKGQAAIETLLARTTDAPIPWPRPDVSGVFPYTLSSQAASAAADIDDEIAKIERRLRTDRRGYFRDEDMQQRYRDLLTIRERRRR